MALNAPYTNWNRNIITEHLIDMELTTMQMYWLLKLDDISFLFGAIFFLGLAVLILVMIFGGLIIDDLRLETPRKTVKKFFKITISIISISLILGTFLPTTKQMAAIIVVPKIINNEQIQQMPERIIDLGLEWLEDLRPELKERE